MARILLLTDQPYADAVARPLLAAVPGLFVEPVFSLDDLDAAMAKGTAGMRLVSFGAGVIVPGEILSRLPGPAYNFHPGPPEYPGLFPSVFAIYDGAKTFGVTLHEMTTAVDAGSIIAVDRFAMPDDAERMVVDILAFRALLGMLERFALLLADETTPLPKSGETWSAPVRRRKDFDALCQLPQNVTAEEFARRYRAVGEGPQHALHINLFGHSFKLDNHRHDEVVVRGGNPVGK